MRNILKLKVLWTKFRLTFNCESPCKKSIQKTMLKNIATLLQVGTEKNSGRGRSVASDENIEMAGVIGKQRT